VATLASLASLDGQVIAVYRATQDFLALVAGQVLVASLVIAEAELADGRAIVASLVGREFLVTQVADFLVGRDFLALAESLVILVVAFLDLVARLA
jgi:hypothetical protein